MKPRDVGVGALVALMGYALVAGPAIDLHVVGVLGEVFVVAVIAECSGGWRGLLRVVASIGGALLVVLGHSAPKATHRPHYPPGSASVEHVLRRDVHDVLDVLWPPRLERVRAGVNVVKHRERLAIEAALPARRVSSGHEPLFEMPRMEDVRG